MTATLTEPAAPPAAVPLAPGEIQRYSRHLIIPEVGMSGQRRLKAASVLCVGTGGLGSPLALYLAAAGVGTIGLVDFDDVDLTNLQRQILHGTEDVGRPKLESARRRITALNPEVRVVLHDTRLAADNALELLAPYDVIVDGTDNFPTRFLVNDACVLLGKPNVYGAIFRFEGQLAVFDARVGPCYRCLYRELPPPGLVPSCAEGGVLGVLPGIIGTMQALETLKLLLGIGRPAIGSLLLFDALEQAWQPLTIRKDPDCPICGVSPSITSLRDEAHHCSLTPPPVPGLAPREVAARLAAGDALQLVDVREPHEWDITNLADLGARLLPLGQLNARRRELDPDRPVVLICRTGARSADAARELHRAGFREVWNMVGGMQRWSEEVDPSRPRY